MAITVELLEEAKGNSGARLVVEFNDDGERGIKKYRDYKGSPSEFIELVRSQVAKREEAKLYDFSSHVGKLIDITPDPVIPPTDEEIAKAQWFSDDRKMKKFEYLVKRGIMAANDPLIAPLATKLVDNWLNSYFGDL